MLRLDTVEKRGKQEPVREKCRLIGFDDDDDTEEMAGYKLLLESDQSVLYCNDVIFTKEEMVPLPDLEYYVPELFDVFRANDDGSDFIPSTATSGTTNRDTESVGNVEVESEEEDITSNELVVQEIQEGYLAGENSGIDVESDPEDQRMEEILKELQSRDWYKNANLVKFFLTHTQDKKVPKNQKEAYASVDREKWIAAEKDEMESI